MLWSSRGLKRKVEQIQSDLFFLEFSLELENRFPSRALFFLKTHSKESLLLPSRRYASQELHRFILLLRNWPRWLWRKKEYQKEYSIYFTSAGFEVMLVTVSGAMERPPGISRKNRGKKGCFSFEFFISGKKLRFFPVCVFAFFATRFFFLLDHISRKMSLLVKVIPPAPPQRPRTRRGRSMYFEFPHL